ncbi:MAG: hypothetical protein WBG66_13930 [Geitlerinemataceae cyanobacterium]
MPFPAYSSLGEVLQEFQIRSTQRDYIVEIDCEIRPYFREELEFCWHELVFDNSEYAICENLIYPILKEVYRGFTAEFTLWSHQFIRYTDRLSGTPDYLLSKKSDLGREVLEQPFLIVVEAKQDDFGRGWGQCLAEMVAVREMNINSEQLTVFGIVTNGKVWEFGQLKNMLFTKNFTAYTIYDLDRLFGAVRYVFQQCQQELAAIAHS